MFGESFGAGVGDAARDPADVEAANERATSILYQQAVDVAAYVHAVRRGITHSDCLLNSQCIFN
jgi:hypothetical protein